MGWILGVVGVIVFILVVKKGFVDSSGGSGSGGKF